MVFCIFFANAENVISSSKEAIYFCVNSLVPSIFIFMIFCSFILYTKALESIFNRLPNGLLSFLGICRKYVLFVLLCSICGFVNGPKLICEDYKENGGEKVDFSNAIILSSNAGIGFLIACVGSKIWGSVSFGLYLFCSQIFCSFLLGKLLLRPSKKSSELSQKNHEDSHMKALENSVQKDSVFKSFFNAVSSSSFTMISMCSFVIVFSVFSEILRLILNFDINSNGYYLLNIFLEFCKGSFFSVSFSNINLCAFFTGFCIGFGGICVHFQTFAVCEGYPLNKLKFVIFKFIHGILCGACAFFYVFFSKIEPKSVTFLTVQNGDSFRYILLFLLIMLILTSIYYILKKFFSK